MYRFRLGPHAGRLGLDMPTLAALLGEARPERCPKPLRAVLLADALQACSAALSAATRLPFEWTPDDEGLPPGDPQALARFRVEGTGWRGFVQFDDPAALALVAPPPAEAAAPSGQALWRLGFPLRFEIGGTRIRLHEVRGIARGDIVSVERWRAAGAAVVVEAALGGRAGWHFTGLAEGTRIIIQQARYDTMNRHPEAAPAPADSREGAELMLDRLDALEVSLRFEVGELELSLGELRNVRPGHVFELGQPLNRSPVRILAHGNLLGTGTLVAVGERLGVRVSEFAPGEL
ncbi:MAG TPA: type III secretion system cytoplasmic ring protein SctQ [Burkholderiaceae bacterium]